MKFNLKIMHQHFLYYYILAHLVLLSFIVGWSVSAFVVLSGGGVSVPDVLLDDRAVVGNNRIDSQIAAATSSAYARQVVRVAGGCEKWDSEYYFRIKTWGQATTTYNGVPATANCYCPSGFSKILIRTSTSSVQNVHKPEYEWRSHYVSTYDPPNYPLCARVADTDSHPLLQVINDGSCYALSCADPKCCCTCDDAIKEERYYDGMVSLLKDDLQKSSIFSQRLRNYLFPSVLAADATAHGCDLIILHSSNNDLYYPIITTNSTWLCVNISTSSTVTGWHN